MATIAPTDELNAPYVLSAEQIGFHAASPPNPTLYPERAR